MNTHRTLISLCLSVALLTGCTKVDLCGGAIHPHTGAVRFSYQWTDSTAIRPDSMMVLANRIVGTWHAVYCTTANEYANNGTCHHGHIASGKYESDSLGTGTVDMFEVKQGDYQFVTVNGNAHIESFVYNNLSEYCTYDSVHIEDINIAYKEYKLTDPAIQSYTQRWKNLNPYSNYIASYIDPIYVSTVTPRTVYADTEVEVGFTPQPISQNIGFCFKLHKDSTVVIDSIMAEISGIPTRIHLDGSIYQEYDADGQGYIPRTAKMLFKVNLDEVNDTLIDCSARIAVSGLVSNQYPDLTMGEGILLLGIYAHAIDQMGEQNSKSIYARINLYHTLAAMDPPLLRRDEMGNIVHGTKEDTIFIEHRLFVEHDLVIQNAEGGLSTDRWEQVIEDIDIDI